MRYFKNLSQVKNSVNVGDTLKVCNKFKGTFKDATVLEVRSNSLVLGYLVDSDEYLQLRNLGYPDRVFSSLLDRGHRKVYFRSILNWQSAKDISVSDSEVRFKVFKDKNGVVQPSSDLIIGDTWLVVTFL